MTLRGLSGPASSAAWAWEAELSFSGSRRCFGNGGTDFFNTFEAPGLSAMLRMSAWFLIYTPTGAGP